MVLFAISCCWCLQLCVSFCFHFPFWWGCFIIWFYSGLYIWVSSWWHSFFFLFLCVLLNIINALVDNFSLLLKIIIFRLGSLVFKLGNCVSKVWNMGIIGHGIDWLRLLFDVILSKWSIWFIHKFRWDVWKTISRSRTMLTRRRSWVVRKEIWMIRWLLRLDYCGTMHLFYSFFRTSFKVY